MDVLGFVVVMILIFPNWIGGPLLAGVYKAFKREMKDDA